MKIIVTVQELMDRGLWTAQNCDVVGINPYAFADGLISKEQEIELSEDKAKIIGLIKS